MAFLDDMVGDLLQRSSRRGARGLVRRIGAGRLLMMGGAALIGAAVAQKSASASSAANARATAGSPPPLPPLPTAGASPAPLPPLPQTGNREDAAAKADGTEMLGAEALYALLRTMVAAALADGSLGADEKRIIDQRLEQAPLSDDQVAQVRRDLVVPPSPAEIAGLVQDPGQREMLFRAAVLVTASDEEVVAAESAWLESLAGALGIDQSRRQELAAEITVGSESG